jgi:2-polyprenyl-3-methyl-5-hydroxy-6-metoxy-1,4-benzoquinol methylase
MATGQGVRDYLLGSSPREQERLELQASMVGGWTRQYLLSAGLDHGMRVLDLGCGVGNVSLLAAEIVGPSGSVTGIDRDGSAVEKARQRAAVHEHSQTIDFACSNVLDFHSGQKYDAVIGRYILLYQPDPAAALRHAAEQVRPGGIICFHEMSFGHPHRGYPEDTLFGRMFLLIGETFRRTGIDPDMGLHLVRHFVAAGLPRPTVKADVPIAGEAGSYAYWWLAETLRSLLPRIHDFGLATAEVIEIDTLAQRMEEEAVAHDSELVGPLQFGAWTTRP